jgi:hypothetical protein
MNEEQWLACTDPGPMLEFLRTNGRASDRKLRLFLVAACRCVWDWLLDESCRQAVVMAERFADNLASAAELAVVAESGAGGSQIRDGEGWWAEANVSHVRYGPPPGTEAEVEAALHEADMAQQVAGAAFLSALAADVPIQLYTLLMLERTFWLEQAEWASYLRDILGNPFRPLPPLSPSLLGWNNATVVKMAKAIYEDRRFEDMLVLANALEEAGCQDQDILRHCREQQTVHVPGCWVVDLLLNKK